jgi:hypothetical protein
MKLVAVSIVKNEADVIEAFVRHTGAWVDEHLIFDHDSTDGTREILSELVREGAALRLFGGTALANLQQDRSNHLARLAFSDMAADWVLPLDADEFLVSLDRTTLESALTRAPVDQPVSVALINYSPTTVDDAGETNPVKRIRHRQHGPASTHKIFIPRSLGLRPDTVAGKGNHALFHQTRPVPAYPLTEVWLAHFALRSPQQQVLRVVTAELQKLSRGKAHEGLDTHYRLGFQLLSEDADLFFSTVLQPPERLRSDPVAYLGGPLLYSPGISAFARAARALVPFLERLAHSHGALIDRTPAAALAEQEVITPLPLATRSIPLTGENPFSGFKAVSGWEPEEGPVPEAFLPRFHWATAPGTALDIDVPTGGSARLEAQVLSYAEQQVVTVFLNDVELCQLRFPRINQKETLAASLSLRPGINRVFLRYSASIDNPADPRKLAVIFLSLRIVSLNSTSRPNG